MFSNGDYSGEEKGHKLSFKIKALCDLEYLVLQPYLNVATSSGKVSITNKLGKRRNWGGAFYTIVKTSTSLKINSRVGLRKLFSLFKARVE